MRARRSRLLGFARPSDRGSVILFVLGVILLTAFLLTRLIDRAGGELLAESKAASRTALRDEAYSGLEVTLAVLADASAIDSGLHSPQQGWDRPLDYSGYEPPAGFDLAISFEDETGKLPLGSVNAAVLQNFLVAIGATTAEAERLADALLAWMKSDYLPGTSEADPRTYENAALPYAPPHRPLHTFEELRAIAIVRDLFLDTDGQWTELGQKFRADVSLQTFTKVNINSARPSVLVAYGIDPTHAAAVVEDLAPSADPKQPPKFYRTINEAAAAQGADIGQAGLSADIQCLRVRVTAKRGSRVFLLEAVVQAGNTGGRANTSNGPSSTPPTNPDTSTEINTAPATPVDPRATTSKSIDYPFRILELRETDGPAQ